MFILGRKPYGRVNVCDGTFVVTDFMHVNFLPLVPTGSHLVLSRSEDGVCQNVPVATSWTSVLAAYLRTWGAALALVSAVLTVSNAADPAAALRYALLAIATAAVVLWSWMRLGRLSAEEQERRRIYAEFTGHAVDVALLGPATELRDALHARVASEARGLMSPTYRTVQDPETEWHAIALTPTVQGEAYLRAALTLARLEWARGNGATRAQMAEAHAKIWEKLSALRTSSARA